jgi:hypothetical protein
VVVHVIVDVHVMVVHVMVDVVDVWSFHVKFSTWNVCLRKCALGLCYLQPFSRGFAHVTRFVLLLIEYILV